MDEKELITTLKEMKLKYERIRGSQKFGIGVHFWDGRVQGIQDAIDVVVSYLNTQ